MGKVYRVAQWATGNVGSRALRHVIQHPDMELVAVWVSNPAKVGKDAGELAGVADTGVKAVGTIEDVLAAKPDAVLYMPHVFHLDEVCRFLESGVNVVSTRMELQNPRALNPAWADRLEAACKAGGTSVHATGSSPGFITEAMPIVMASIQRRMDSFRIDEFADCSSRNSPEMIFQMMGFGAQPGPGSDGHRDHAKYSFAPSLQLVATALGMPIEEWTVDGAQGLARQDVQIAAGVVPKGTVAATRTTLTGWRGGKKLMQFCSTWFVSTDVDTSDGEEWEFRTPSGWHVVMMGDCPLDISISYPCKPEDYADMTPGLTANRPVNALPFVCDAAPGIVTTVDLPQVIARLG
ncbi:MAG: dihydrodipicolinate reductase [Sphingomonadales bacterium]|nr:dihydrodipicolinate reductase [Sphingomonadales bacterium]